MRRLTMTIHRPLAAAVAAVAVAGGVLATGPAAGANPVPGSVTQKLLQRDVNAIVDTGVIGAQAAVLDHGRTVKAGAGVADVRTRRPVPLDGRFRPGSITKTFVATVVLQLAGEGRLSLDDKVGRWLPGVVTGNGNDGQKVTIRQLLQHTSGIPSFSFEDVPVFTVEDYYLHRFDTYRPEQMVALAMKHPPTSEPGAGWAYSNTNYVLAGMIIQQVTGNTWDREVSARLVQPLGLRGTTAPGRNPAIPGVHAQGYDHRPDGSVLNVTLMNTTWGGAAGALISTTDDLNRFAAALQDGTLLRPAQLAEMRNVYPVSEDAGYGLGIGRIKASCGIEYWTHDGGVHGYTSQFAVTSDGTRSVTASLTTTGFLPSTWNAGPMYQALDKLIDNAICTGR